MKKHFTVLYIFVFCLFVSSTLFGQEKIEISLNGINTKKLKVSKGSPVFIKFIGINPLKYSYALNHQFVNQFSENTVDSIIPSNGDNKNDNVTIDSETLEIEDQIKVKNEEIETRKTASLKANPNQKSNIDNEIVLLEGEVNKLKLKLINLQKIKLNLFQELIDEYEEEAKILEIKLVVEENSDLKNARNAYELILENSKSIKIQLENVITNARNQDVLNLDALKKLIINFQTANERNLNNLNKLLTEYPFLDDVPIFKLKESIENNFKEIKKNIDLVNTLQDSIQTLPLDYHGENIDYIKVSLEVLPLDDKSKPTSKITNYDYKVWIKGGFKIDFSAGIFLSSLRDNTYLTIKQDSPENESDNLFKIVKENQGKYELGIGSTVNFNFRTASFTSFGGSVGGYVTSGQKFRLVTGLNLVLGKMQRVMIGGGLVMGEYTSLSNKVNLTDFFDLGAEGTVPTVQKFDFGHYFSFTYNIGKAKGKEE